MNRSLLALVLLAAFVPRHAQAYVDPGSGYLIFQLIASIAVGALVGFRKFRTVVGGLFRKRTAQTTNEPQKKKAA